MKYIIIDQTSESTPYIAEDGRNVENDKDAILFNSFEEAQEFLDMIKSEYPPEDWAEIRLWE
jgi:hypothetical protein